MSSLSTCCASVRASRAPEQATAGVDEAAQLRLVEQVFNATFAAYSTVLLGGRDEPLYEPSPGPGQPARLYYREDYFASALHEAAHWCIAGQTRREQVDFGYWYEPEGRDDNAQRAFEAVESGPQALEWFFAQASGRRFRLSEDNLSGTARRVPWPSEFALAVLERATHWQQTGLPARAAQFFDALAEAFGSGLTPDGCTFTLEALR